MNWFEQLTGFKEESPEQVRSNLTLDGERLISKVNGKSMTCGGLETPTLSELRERVAALDASNKGGKLAVGKAVGDVKNFHLDEKNAGGLFQVASQFNLLEMVSPGRTPEEGVGIYEYDHTQGPACAISAGAGTIYRNYFVPVGGKIGQTEHNQIDCLADIGRALGNENNALWEMRNGYALASRDGLLKISEHLRALDATERDRLRGLLRIGIQRNTQVTLNECTHLISQAYCSALPVAYSGISPDLWEDFARLILEASYEAAVCAAILNARATGINRMFLTMIGGGAFGNSWHWITDSIKQVFRRYKNYEIDAVFISYGGSSSQIKEIMQEI